MSNKYAGSIFDPTTPHMIVVSRILGAGIIAGCAAGFVALLLL